MSRPCLSAVLAAALIALASAASAQAPPGPGGPLPGLTPAELASFNDGLLAFTQRFTPPDGLGPVFNDDSCVVCHGGPPGGPVPAGAANPRTVTRFGKAKGRSFDPLMALGGSLVQSKAIAGPCGGLLPETVPPEANVEAQRRTQALFGLGLVDAVPDSTLEALAAAQASSSRRTVGRVNHVLSPSTGTSRAGRFGWKSQVVSLRDFSGDAMLNEIGLTNPLFPGESCPQGDCSLLACNPRPGMNDDGTLVARLTAFQRLLAPPPRGPITPQVLSGEQVFNSLGCNSCHVASMTTGPSDVAALSNQTFHPYSDFLLHDMGGLGDGIVQGEASGSDIRTAPLWGVSRQPTLLHDGRATTVEQAILAHDGQASASRRGYQHLSATDRSNLLAFLGSL